MTYDDFVFLWSFVGILAVVFVGIVSQSRKLRSMRSKDFEWYKAQRTELFRGGRIHCSACDSTNIRTERLMNRTFMRAHLCGQCGTTLHYSKE